MDLVIHAEHPGGPEALKAHPVAQREPGQGETWIQQDAVGVNDLDVTQRSGAVPIPFPSDLGLEAAGRVVAVGPGVDNVQPGDRVAYILGPNVGGRLKRPISRTVRRNWLSSGA